MLGQISSIRELYNGYFYTDGVVHIIDTSSLGRFYNTPHDMNDAGVVIGSHFQDDYRLSYVYQDGVVRKLGNFEYTHVLANSLNNKGWIAGSYSGWKVSGAFVYRDGVFTNLNDLDLDYAAIFGDGDRFTDAIEINNANQILVGDNRGRLFLLTPIPEPERYAIVSLGLGLMVLAARRART